MAELPPARLDRRATAIQEVNGRERPCASPNRSFLAKPAVGGDRGEHLRGAAAGALTMLRVALSADSLQSLRTDPQRRTLIRLNLHLVPFAGIAFLWFIGIVRDRLGAVEDRLFSTDFLGSGLLFVTMLFVGAGTSTSLMATPAATRVNAEVYAFGRNTIRSLFSVYAMRMAAVFTLAVGSRAAGLRDVGLYPALTLRPAGPPDYRGVIYKIVGPSCRHLVRTALYRSVGDDFGWLLPSPGTTIWPPGKAFACSAQYGLVRRPVRQVVLLAWSIVGWPQISRIG